MNELLHKTHFLFLCFFSFLKQLDEFKGFMCISGHWGRVLGHGDHQIWETNGHQLYSWLRYKQLLVVKAAV